MEGPVGAGCVAPFGVSRRREMKICVANRRPRWPRKVPEGGDPERSAGPDAGASGFRPFLPRQNGPAVKAEGAGRRATSNG